MIVSSETGALWATTEEKFTLKKYQAKITQEDGEEKEELVNEAANIVNYMKGSSSHQGLRINAGRKHQITRSFKDEVSGLSVVFSKYPQGGACVANGGKCVLIGTFNEDKGHQSPDCNETITLMARYLAMSTWPEVGSVPVGPASWRNYIDTMLVGKGNVEEAMLCTSSGEILAATENFKVSLLQDSIGFAMLLACY